MSFTTLLIHTVGISQRTVGGSDRYGNEVVTFGAAVPTRARVEHTKSTEILGDRDTTVTWYRVFLPAGTSIDALDRITYDTVTMEVDGEPIRWFDSTQEHHVTALARKVDD